MAFRAALFDMDGVVIDTYESVVAYWDQLAAAQNVVLTDAIYEQHIIGTPSAYTLDVVFSHMSDLERQATLEDIAHYEAELSFTEVPGVTKLLRAMKAAGIPTALVTSAHWHKVNDALAQLGLDGLFGAVITAADVTRGKPHPDCYQLGAKALGLTPDQCVVFEDALPGVRAAVAAGATPIGVARAGTADALRSVGAQAIIPDFQRVAVETNADGGLALRLDALRLPFDVTPGGI